MVITQGFVKPVELKKERGRHNSFEAVIPYSRPCRVAYKNPAVAWPQTGRTRFFKRNSFGVGDSVPDIEIVKVESHINCYIIHRCDFESIAKL